MFDRRRGALIQAVLLAVLATAPANAGAVLDHVGTYVWKRADPDFGGFSGIEISADGTSFHALTDRSHLYWGSIERDGNGVVRDMTVTGKAHLKDSKGKPLPSGYTGDSEGLAIGADGRIHVSFEGLDRVVTYDHPDKAGHRLPWPPHLPGMGQNAGIEALAIRDDGTLVAVPERSASETTPFTVLTFDGKWSRFSHIRRDPRWLAVGADFGPDGWFYLLERDFHGLLGFSSRVRRMRLEADEPEEEQILLTTRPMQHDNLEGISVWHDGTDIRVTLISDDNFLFLQRTEIAEYRLRETEAQALRN